MLRIACFCLVLFILPAQIITPKKDRFSISRKGTVDEKLSEISGWVFVNDSTLVAHNDSGNDPLLYVLNTDGSIRHTTRIADVVNIDFEDIATDGKGNLYIGDIGNNANNRKNLVIYKVKTASILSDTVVSALPIFFSYTEQQNFPPEKSGLYYDAEALTYYADSLWIFTKCRTQPFDGKSLVYSIPTTPGTYRLKQHSAIQTGKSMWMRDAVTAADIYHDELFLLTYNRLMIYDFNNKKAVFKTTVPMTPLSQKEALAVHKDGTIYVVDERQKLIGGGRIFVVTKNQER